jgi:hypothetical protein
LRPVAAGNECQAPSATIGDTPTPIAHFLDGGNDLDPEIKRVMGVAFEMTLATLRLADRRDLANEVIVRRIIALANAGERNPDLLCEAVLKQFREQRAG